MSSHHNPEGRHPPGLNQSLLERELDAALAKYARVEPRPGLEERVLASLAAERIHPEVRQPWWWLALPALAVMLTVLGVSHVWKSAKLELPVHESSVPSLLRPFSLMRDGGGRQISRAHKTRKPPARRSLLVSAAPPPGAATPKLDQFPSPLPLSRQEQILADYVAQFSEQAFLIARFNNEEIQREQIEMLGKPQSGADPATFDENNTTAR